MYVTAVGLWAHLIAAHSDDYGGSPGFVWVYLALLFVGFAIGEWWAVVLPVLNILVAIGSGNGTNPDSDISIVAELTIYSAAGFPLVAIRIAARRWFRRRSLT